MLKIFFFVLLTTIVLWTSINVSAPTLHFALAGESFLLFSFGHYFGREAA